MRGAGFPLSISNQKSTISNLFQLESHLVAGLETDQLVEMASIGAGVEVDSGEAFFTATTWRGRRAMRVSVCNWQTSKEDVDRICRSVSSLLAKEQSAIKVLTGDRT